MSISRALILVALILEALAALGLGDVLVPAGLAVYFAAQLL